jgi:energy-coupling factor transporter ATP-binding protein EcfA2
VVTERRADDLATEVAHLASSLASLAIPESWDRGRLSEKRDWIVRTIRGYLIPRIEDPAAPLTVVFAGPTGAGKSTLLNSVAGGVHSASGPLRPTTKSPLVLASKSRAPGYTDIGGIECQVVTGRAPILRELTLVDTPDIDSTSTEHRVIAETMIDNADIVVYVTSAIRYADLVPWEVLRRAHSRGVPVVHVLNRIKSSSSGALADYKSRLQAEGLGSLVVAVHEHHIPKGGQSVPLAVIQGLRDRLVDVVEARHAGSADLVQSVLSTTLDEVDDVISNVAELANDALAAASRVRTDLSVDLDRITSALSPHVGGSVELDRLVYLAERRIRTRGRVRRRLPATSEVGRGHTLLDASLVVVVDADIRRQSVVETVRQRRLQGRPADTHATVAAAVAAWHQDLDEMPAVVAAIDPALTSLLLARWAVQGDDSGIEAILGLLTDSSELAALVAQARDRLALHLVPVFTSIEFQMTSGTGALVASDAAIYRARAALSAVTARSTFANA